MSKTICFTGHRPKGIPKGSEEWINKQLITAIEKAAKKDYTTFISGGAVGVDQMAARCVLLARAFGPKLELIIARPFPSQDSVWPPHVQVKSKELLKMADKVVDVCEDPYAVWKMYKRDVWMVDGSHVVIAVWKGGPGGTHNCIKYAQASKKPILRIDPLAKEVYWLK